MQQNKDVISYGTYEEHNRTRIKQSTAPRNYVRRIEK